MGFLRRDLRRCGQRADRQVATPSQAFLHRRECRTIYDLRLHSTVIGICDFSDQDICVECKNSKMIIIYGNNSFTLLFLSVLLYCIGLNKPRPNEQLK